IFLRPIALIAVVQLGYLLGAYSLWWQALLLPVFFLGFNVLEASLPSLLSRVAHPSAKGTALGVYNTTQSLGLFAGGALGGWCAKHYGNEMVFMAGGIAILGWLLFAAGMRVPAPRRHGEVATAAATARPAEV